MQKELSVSHAGLLKIRVGDSVIATYGDEADVYARITSIKPSTGVDFRIQRCYRPEETVGGKQPFYGNKELLLTNHLDNLQSAQIVKKINVHSFVDYMKLETVGKNDFFFRFEYEIGSGWLSPTVIEVFCKCLMPFNPDMFTLKCESCKERYHPACINMTLDEAKQLADNFTCFDCLTPDNQGSASAASATVDPSMV